MSHTIVYTKTDESPMMATYSLFPIFKTFLSTVGVDLVLSDISLAGRILATFPDFLAEEQRGEDGLKFLGALVKEPEANVMKLPNISASIPQLQACIAELQSKGFMVPMYPDDPQNEEEKAIKSRYDKIKGSAVNPVLREGNSDRRAPKAVKNYAKSNPHYMGAWSADSKSHVAHMDEGDFFETEQSLTLDHDGSVSIRHVDSEGVVTILKPTVHVQNGEVIDSSVMSLHKLKDFLKEQIADAKEKDVLFSVHLKATMMKVSDPIIFGAVVEAYFAELFEKYADVFAELKISPKNGMGDLEKKIRVLPEAQQAAIRADIAEIYAQQPDLAQVNYEKGITNLHVPSDVIIDASIPAAIRFSGQMWGADGKQKDTKYTIPDRCYAGIYQTVIDFCKEHGAFDVTTMGSVSNVGLMAQKAQEYGSHDKTFQIKSAGHVEVVGDDGRVLMQHEVESGDIWRMCMVKDAPVEDWIELAVRRARITGNPVVFWLSDDRPQDAELIKKIEEHLPELDTEGLEILILSPVDAMQYTLERCKDGLDTISATGNVLRDYLTDLFPILELGTSAKMLSVVPLMNGGGLFETGAGGTAPILTQQLIKENHLKWDSLGEFLAMEASLEHLSLTMNNPKASVLAECLGAAIEDVLMKGKSPKDDVPDLDTRGSHFYLAFYWAQHLRNQEKDTELSALFTPLANQLEAAETEIVADLSQAQGVAVDMQGYFLLSDEMGAKIMRPSKAFNEILDTFAKG